jgi:hypothetical protein
MAIKMPPTAKPALAKAGKDERAEAFIAAGGSPRPPAAPEPAMTKTVVNSRWDVELLRQIDQAAKKQGISRTAWLHVAAAEKLTRS